MISQRLMSKCCNTKKLYRWININACHRKNINIWFWAQTRPENVVSRLYRMQSETKAKLIVTQPSRMAQHCYHTYTPGHSNKVLFIYYRFKCSVSFVMLGQLHTVCCDSHNKQTFSYKTHFNMLCFFFFNNYYYETPPQEGESFIVSLSWIKGPKPTGAGCHADLYRLFSHLERLYSVHMIRRGTVNNRNSRSMTVNQSYKHDIT